METKGGVFESHNMISLEMQYIYGNRTETEQNEIIFKKPNPLKIADLVFSLEYHVYDYAKYCADGKGKQN